MKKSLITGALMIASFYAFPQDNIQWENKRCRHCEMPIKDKQFLAAAISGDKAFTFDAIECLVNFLKGKDESLFDQLWVADYPSNGELVDATTSTYLRSQAIPSPMGSYLSAYRSLETARVVQKEEGGELLNWSQLKARFKDSDLGSLNHPTHHHDRPDTYGPAGVMGDHLHHKGGFMLSMTYIQMNMSGNLQGSSDIDNMEIYQSYMAAPQTMQMDMLMIGAMYAPSERLTLMLMQNLVRKTMDLRNMAGMNFSTESNGLSDLKISVLYGLLSKQNSSIHANGMVNLPVGSVDNRDDTPIMEAMKLPYYMQLGTGTLDFTLGGTYKGLSNKLSWGVQQLNTFRTGENSSGYRFGDQFELNGWAAYRFASWVSLSARFQGIIMNKIDGADSELNPMMAPPANSDNTGFKRVFSYLGANFSLGERAVWRDFKLGVEYGLPLYEYVDGVQMSVKGVFSAGVKYSI